MEFSTISTCGLARCGVIRVNRKKCKTPGIWLGCRLENALDVRIIKTCRSLGIHIDGVIVSAHSLITNLYRQRQVLGIGVSGFLDAHRTLLVADAGSYSFNKKKIPVRIRDIFDLQKEMRCDIIVTYDYQVNPDMDQISETNVILRNINNYTYYMSSDKSSNCVVMPVIHGYSSKLIKNCVETILVRFNPTIVALGSLVPLLLPYNNKRTLIAIKTIMLVRQLLPDDIYLHVFGTGSPTIAPLFFYLGADSVDSQGWMTAAAFGKIYLPGGGQRFITKKGKNFKFKQWSKEINWKSYWCECPVCREFTLEDLEKRKDLRALHNIWVYSKETERVRREINKGNYNSYLRQKFFKTSLWKLFNKTINLLKNSQ